MGLIEMTDRRAVGSSRKTSKDDWLADYRSIAELEAVTADVKKQEITVVKEKK